jgi:antirestriction protein ArdC
MTSEDIKKITDRATEQLIAALNEGRSETLTHYLATMGRFHRYSLGNIMLIASQKPDATRVAGFRTWHSLGRFVKKGEKGILIVAPIVWHRIDAPAQQGTEESAPPRGFRAVYVFDIGQTEGQELPEICAIDGDPGAHKERLSDFTRACGISIEYSIEIAPALGISSGGQITLLPGRPAAEEFVTLAHELAHELLHRTERRSTTTKCVRETEAEAVAFVVGQAIGLEMGSAAKDYIQLYNGDAKLLIESLEFVQKTANAILAGITDYAKSSPPL